MEVVRRFAEEFNIDLLKGGEEGYIPSCSYINKTVSVLFCSCCMNQYSCE